jgi:hypothetical protein
MCNEIVTLFRYWMGTSKSAAPPKSQLNDPKSQPVHKVSGGKRILYSELPNVYYKNPRTKPNNTEPRHPDHMPAVGVKITRAQRMEFKKRAEEKKGCRAERK